jgi:hypothetical protein
MRATPRTEIKFTIGSSEYDLWKTESVATGVSMSALVRDYAKRFLAEREATLKAAETGEVGNQLHSILAAFENRVASTVNRASDDIDALRAEVHVLTALTAVLLKTYLAHTPEVPADLRDAHSASALARYDRIIGNLHKEFDRSEGERRPKVLAAVEDAA